MFLQPAYFRRGVARQDGVANLLDAALLPAEGVGDLRALGRGRGIAPQLHGRDHPAVGIHGYKAMLLAGHADRGDRAPGLGFELLQGGMQGGHPPLASVPPLFTLSLCHSVTQSSSHSVTHLLTQSISHSVTQPFLSQSLTHSLTSHLQSIERAKEDERWGQ